MEWIIASDETRINECLHTLKFWINSIIVHTYDDSKKETAPIFLVGTHKDQVSDPVAHVTISEWLELHFSSSLAWPSVVMNDKENGEKGLCFYPVNNVVRRDDPSAYDPTINDMMAAVEKKIGDSDYIRIERPLSYFRTLDTFMVMAMQESCLTLAEATEVALACGVKKDEVESMLKLFHEAGVVMYHGMWHSFCVCTHVCDILYCCS